jgi:L-rhamnose mutarotase
LKGESALRIAGKMKVLEGCCGEYQKRHDEIWPMMAAELKKHGYHFYSIFLEEETCTLFYYAQIDDKELMEKMSETEICRKWWHFMKDIMETNEDESPKSVEFKEVFYLE